MLRPAQCGRCSKTKTRRGLDYVRSLDWVQNGKGLLWLSERDGWRHAYVISRPDGKTTLITNFPAT